MNQDLLHKYFKGETSVDEEKRILNWVDESEENRKTLQKERCCLTSPFLLTLREK